MKPCHLKTRLELTLSRAWSIWAYKDINVMGLMYVSPESVWMKTLGPIIRKKRDLAVDSWAYDDAYLQDGLFGPLHKWFEDNVPAQYNKKYPWQWRMHMHIDRLGLCDIHSERAGNFRLGRAHECALPNRPWKLAGPKSWPADGFRTLTFGTVGSVRVGC